MQIQAEVHWAKNFGNKQPVLIITERNIELTNTVAENFRINAGRILKFDFNAGTFKELDMTNLPLQNWVPIQNLQALMASLR